jgi:hypothetical protein
MPISTTATATVTIIKGVPPEKNGEFAAAVVELADGEGNGIVGTITLLNIVSRDFF